jgi:hypothetical protein
MGLFDFLKGKQSPEAVLAEAYRLVDESLRAGFESS